MYGLTRGTITLLGAALAGFLIWLASQVDEATTGGYWSVYGLLAAAGLTMAFSQILGGWTKWGWPRLSLNVFLLAFVPVLIAGGWVLVAGQPHGNWFQNHVGGWSQDLSIDGLVRDLTQYAAVLGFGIGLVFGFTFDTSGPAAYGPFGRRRRAASIPAGGATPPPPPPETSNGDGDLAREPEPVGADAPADRRD
jgi:hypothetical protein